MSKNMCLAASAAGLVLAATAAAASSTTSAHITTVTADQGVFFIYLDQAPQGTVPTCATLTNSNHRYVIDLSTATGKVQIATALSAQARGSTVNVTGMGAATNTPCSVWGDTETLQWLLAN